MFVRLIKHALSNGSFRVENLPKRYEREAHCDSELAATNPTITVSSLSIGPLKKEMAKVTSLTVSCVSIQGGPQVA